MASKKKSLYDWMSTRVNVNIRNEENYALKTTIRFSYGQALVLGTTFFVLFSVFSLWIATKVIGIWYNPREDYFNTKRKVIQLAMSVDSLGEQIRQKDLFISHIKSIVETGEVNEPSKVDVKANDDTKTNTNDINLDFLPEIDSVFRNQFESSAILSVSKEDNKNGLNIPILMSPVEGVVTQNFDLRKKHYGVKINTNRGEPIKAINEGVVVVSYWTIEQGYVIGIQHSNSLVSVYKHKYDFYKNIGSWVGTGDVISMSSENESDVLTFEIWMRGEALNPNELILF